MTREAWQEQPTLFWARSQHPYLGARALISPRCPKTLGSNIVRIQPEKAPNSIGA